LPSKSVAHVCLRSWKRMWRRPAFLRSGARLRCLRLDGLIGVSASVVKTGPSTVLEVSGSLCLPYLRGALVFSSAPTASPVRGLEK
jgi:hypothetical protein